MRTLVRIAALAALSLLAVVGSAFADARDMPVDTKQLNFVYRNALRSNSFRDSSIVTAKASYAGLSLFDTTEAVDLRNAHYRAHSGVSASFTPTVGGWNVGDSLWAFDVTWGDLNNTARAGVDSLELTVQGSPDGFVWTSIDTIGVGTKLRADITSVGVSTASLFSTQRGIGTKRINWDRPAVNFLRFILREDPNAPVAAAYALWVTTKRLGNNIPTGYR